jgi:hypothetical protein
MSDVDWITIALAMFVAIQLNIPNTAIEAIKERKRLKKVLGGEEFGSNDVKLPKSVSTLNAPLIRLTIKNGITNSLIFVL